MQSLRQSTSVNLSTTEDSIHRVQVKTKYIQYSRKTPMREAQTSQLTINKIYRQTSQEDVRQVSVPPYEEARRLINGTLRSQSVNDQKEKFRQLQTSVEKINEVEDEQQNKAVRHSIIRKHRPISRSTFVNSNRDESTPLEPQHNQTQPTIQSFQDSSIKSQSLSPIKRKASILKQKIKTFTLLNRHIKASRNHQMMQLLTADEPELLNVIQRKEFAPVLELAVKCLALVNLGTIATRIQQYEASIRLLKKALQYSWKVNNLEYELEIYELIGVNYYYLGDITQAKFYHDKSVRCDNEIESSPLRTISLAIIDRQLRTSQSSRLTEFNRLFLFRLSLPIRNKFDTVNEVVNCDTFKSTTYRNAKAENIIRTVMEEPEFISFELDQPVYSRLRSMKNQHPASLRTNMSEDIDFTFVEAEKTIKRRVLIKQKVPKFKSIFGTQEEEIKKKMPVSIDEHPHIFNIPIDRQIRTRLRDYVDPVLRLKQIHGRVANNLHLGGLHRRARVNLNHMTEQKIGKIKTSSTDPRVLNKRYKEYFDQLLQTIA